jgi:hypothetical protein
MTFIALFPFVAGLGLVLILLRVIAGNAAPSRDGWMVPAAGSLLFLGFSATAAITEGGLGFWTEHTRNLWGNQIWVDLLCAAGVGFYLIVPPAKALGMRLVPWLFVVVGTGSIGFLAMLARFLYLRDRAALRG